MTALVRKMMKEDLKRVLEIENSSFKCAWTKENFLYELLENPVSNLYVILDNDEILGFIDYWITFDSATIAQIAVIPASRKCGYASILMNKMLDDLKGSDVVYVTLEVRISNTSARAFYLKHDFVETLTKERYYENGEDAIYMMRAMI